MRRVACFSLLAFFIPVLALLRSVPTKWRGAKVDNQTTAGPWAGISGNGGPPQCVGPHSLQTVRTVVRET